MRDMRLHTLPLILGATLLLVGVAFEPAPSPRVPASALDSLDDGPHVYWQNGTQAIVFYLCGGEAPAERLEPKDTVAFNGLCADSTERYTLRTRPPEPARHSWQDVPRFLAISDIHGEYEAMVSFLEGAGVTDSTGRWSWGGGHLVVVGDIVDRGAGVTECLWFLHRLEQEAERAGGRVHVLLGNHEMMVMRNDLRYVNEKYTDGIVRYLGVRYPDLFGPDMELGRWLRSKPIVLKLNDILFVHGGLSPELAARGLDIEKLNAAARASLDVSSVELMFSEVPGLLVGSSGPFWYRGYMRPAAGRYAAATPAQLDSVLATYDASAVVVGHTDIGQVTRLHDGRVYGVDVSLEDLGAFQGLLWEDGVFSVVSGVGTVTPLQ
jgi:hypothetical protein